MSAGRRHGTHACYVWGPEPGPGKGCRCEECRDANRAYERERARRVAPPFVDAGRARDHVEWLRTQGVGVKAVAKAAGVSTGSLSKLVYGRGDRGPTKRIRPETEAAILAVRPSDASGGARVPAERFHRDVATLLGRGWTRSAIARAVGQSPSNFGRSRDLVAKATADAVHALLDQPPPPRRSRWGETPVEWDPEAERKAAASRAAEAERRAHYRAIERGEPEPTPLSELWDEIGQGWRSRSACRLVPDAQRWVFWAAETDQDAIAAAKAVCATCSVAADCLRTALASPEAGVWGGTTESERRRHERTAAA